MFEAGSAWLERPARFHVRLALDFSGTASALVTPAFGDHAEWNEDQGE